MEKLNFLGHRETQLRIVIEKWHLRFGIWFTSFTGFIILAFGLVIVFKHPDYNDPYWVRVVVASFLILGGWFWGRRGVRQFVQYVWLSILVFPLWSLWVLWANDIAPRYLMTVYLVLLGYCTVMPNAKQLTWWALGYTSSVIGLILLHDHPRTPLTDIAPTFLFSGVVVYSLCYALLLAREAFLKSEEKLTKELERVEKLNRELNSTQVVLKNALKSKSDFLSTVSHELRTPMHAVIGLSDVLLQEQPRDDQKDSLLTLQQSSKTMMSLINNILDFSKIEAGAMEIESTPFDLRLLVMSVAESFQWQVRQKELHFILEGLPAQSYWVLGDPVRITQILNNLLSNAIKFTKAQGYVQLHLVSDGSRWHFSVKDSGIGMSPLEMSRILEPFVQADTSTTRKFGGTGLGLSISKRLLELMNSQLLIESKPSEGSQFSFVIELTPSRAPETQALAPVMRNWESKRLLLVEDNPINVKVAQKILSRWDFQVDVAENGKVALERIFKNDVYDAILLDMHMPVMDGIECLRKIRTLSDSQKARTPVLVLTASVTGSSLKKLQDLEYQGFLAKPFKPKDLEENLAQVLI